MLSQISTFPDSRKKFRRHTTSRNPTRTYVANPSFTPLTMATLETAGGPLQSLWSPTPTCMHADSCQKPHLPLFMAILPEQRLTSTQKSPGTAMHARGYDRSTKLIGSTVDPTMDYTARPVNPNVRHKGVTATSMTTHHIIAHQYSKNTEKDTTFFTPFT